MCPPGDVFGWLLTDRDRVPTMLWTSIPPRLRPLTFAGIHRASSTHVRARPGRSFAPHFREWLQIGYTWHAAANERRKKEAPQVFTGLSFTQAEGTGFEPATPYGAPHFQFQWTHVHYCPLCPKTYTVAGLRDGQIPPPSIQSTSVRRFGYKLATRSPVVVPAN
jgi:hypothetical protein